MEFTNVKDVNLMTWETDTKKRNTNNVISFYLDVDKQVSIGDLIRATPSNGFSAVSTYELTDIKERRAAALSGKDYITAATKWSMAV